jgi:hypothetical protein
MYVQRRIDGRGLVAAQLDVLERQMIKPVWLGDSNNRCAATQGEKPTILHLTD